MEGNRGGEMGRGGKGRGENRGGEGRVQEKREELDPSLFHHITSWECKNTIYNLAPSGQKMCFLSTESICFYERFLSPFL